MEAAGDMPDWLGGSTGAGKSYEETPAPADEAPLMTGDESALSEDTSAWLRGLGEDRTADEPTAIEDSSLPDWFSSGKPEQTGETPSIPVAPQASLENLGVRPEQDDAVAWLESLASKHGAKPEELVTDPGARSETPPEWVEQARAIAEAHPEEAFPAKPEPLEIASDDETGLWLRGLMEKESFTESSAEPKQEETIEPVPSDDRPAWLKDLEEPAAAAQKESEPGLGRTSPESAAADLPAWLQGLDEESTPEPSPGTPTLSELEKELPPWLQEAEIAEPAQPTTSAEWQPVGTEVSYGEGYTAQTMRIGAAGGSCAA
jgi:hypothetical protein